MRQPALEYSQHLEREREPLGELSSLVPDYVSSYSRVVLSRPSGNVWPWDITYGSIVGWMNIQLPPNLMFTRGTGF